MKVLGIVPARAGSKRLPRKNVTPLGGKPLVQWAIESAIAAQRLHQVVVSSDDDEVLDLAKAFASVTALRRPAALATDAAPAIDFVHHALRSIDDDRFDAVAVIQPTSPFTMPSDIDAVIDLLDATGSGSAVSVVRVAHDLHPTKFKRLENGVLRDYFEDESGGTAAHQLEEVYVRNGSVYATTIGSVETGLLITADCRGYEMPRNRSIDINDEVDLMLATAMVDLL